MGKQPGFLEHVSDPAFFRGKINPCFPVKAATVSNGDPAPVRPGKPGHHVHHRGFAGTGRPEQGRDPWLFRGKRDIQEKPPCCFCTRTSTLFFVIPMFLLPSVTAFAAVIVILS